MAHSAKTRQAVRSHYVYDYLPLNQSAAQEKVTAETAGRWKAQALKDGDDWDQARNAYLMAQGGIEGITNAVLEKFTLQFNATLAALDKDEDMGPIQRAEALSRMADAYTKTMKSAAGSAPKTHKLSVAMEVLQQLSDYIKEHYPAELPRFVHILEPFGQQLTKRLK